MVNVGLGTGKLNFISQFSHKAQLVSLTQPLTPTYLNCWCSWVTMAFLEQLDGAIIWVG